LGSWLDWLAIRLAVGAALGPALSGGFALAMIGTRQPARRVFLARAALVGLVLLALALVPLGEAWALAMRRALPAWAVALPGELGVAWRPAAAVAALGGWLVSAGWLALGQVAMGRVSRRARPVDPATRAVLDALGGPTACGAEARFSPDLTRPIAAGWTRPRLILPLSLAADPGDEALRLALAHELAHCRRRDVPFSALGQLVGAIWFFLPPVRWIERQMRRDQELLADRDAAERLGRGPLPYAATLLDLAGGGCAPGPDGAERPPVGPGVRRPSAAGGLGPRLAVLLHSPFGVEADVPPWYRAAFAAVCGLVALAAGLLPRGGVPIAATAGPVAPTAAASRFVAPALELQGFGPDGRGAGIKTAVPVRLPPTFDLTLEVDTALLERLDAELAGARIRVAALGPADATDLHRWTALRVRREGDTLLAWADGRPIPATPVEGPAPSTLTLVFADLDRLSVRNLVLEW
jgi:hypothetical protein